MTTNLKPVAKIEETTGLLGQRTWKVRITYPHAGVDRVCTYSIQCRTEDTAQRAARAVDAHAVTYGETVCRDVNDQTYVSARSRLTGKRIEQDLDALGF